MNLSKEELETWLDREHPSGKVDWRKEYERLWSVLDQALPVVIPTIKDSNKCLTGVLLAAHAMGERLLDQS